jgi:hypothetical protein
MLSITHKVEQIVSESPFLTEGIALGLINLSALARRLRPQLESDLYKPVGQAAIVMALRRLSERLPQQGQSPAPVQPVGELSTRSELSISTFRLSDSSRECQRRLLALAAPYPGLYLTVTHGMHEMLVVCARPLTHLVDEAFYAERLLARVDPVSALTLRLAPERRRMPGVYHAVLQKLAWDKVSVAGMMCSLSELTLLLEQSQIGAAFSALSQLA